MAKSSKLSKREASEKEDLDRKTQARKRNTKLTVSLLKYATKIAKECGAQAIFAYVDAIPEGNEKLEQEICDKVWYITRTSEETMVHEEKEHRVIQVPNVPLTRMGRIKLAVLNALTKGLLEPTDTIVCLSGLEHVGALDTLVVMDVGKEFEMFSTPTAQEAVSQDFEPLVLERILELAVALGTEGREGRPVGTIFVLGDTERVIPVTEQLILNPFMGYPPDKRSILDPSMQETIKELATIDGAFLVRGDGVVESAGAYLKTGTTTAEELPQGLGTRHHAAAAITNITGAVAVSVSASTGNVTVYRGGRIVTEIQRPRLPHKQPETGTT